MLGTEIAAGFKEEATERVNRLQSQWANSPSNQGSSSPVRGTPVGNRSTASGAASPSLDALRQSKEEAEARLARLRASRGGVSPAATPASATVEPSPAGSRVSPVRMRESPRGSSPAPTGTPGGSDSRLEMLRKAKEEAEQRLARLRSTGRSDASPSHSPGGASPGPAYPAGVQNHAIPVGTPDAGGPYEKSAALAQLRAAKEQAQERLAR